MAGDGLREIDIKIIGVGGAGSNAVDRMIQIGIPGVDFVAANTDLQALFRSEAPTRIHLGASLTRSRGAGGDPAIGAAAAEQSRDALEEALHGADMVFVTAGMGGGTGTGAAPLVARIAHEAGALTIGVVTKPFSFEGPRRMSVAEEGIGHLEKEVDALVVVSNDRLLEMVNRKVSLDVAFRVADEVLRQAVQGIAELAMNPGLINLDFADIRSIMEGAGRALISIGYGEGEEKAVEAARVALASPLLNIEFIHRTERLLVNITGSDDLTLAEVQRAMDLISRAATPEAEILFGVVMDPRMRGRTEVILIAAGVESEEKQVTPHSAHDFSPARVLHDDLAVPAFMRAQKHVRLRELDVDQTR